MAEHYKIAIIGAGPGGLGAAANAAKQGLSYVLFEKAEIGNTIYDYQLRKHVMAEPGNLPLRAEIGFEQGTREQILDVWNSRVAELSMNVSRTEVRAIKKTGDNFAIEHGGGQCTADAVILAIGNQGTPRKLGVPGSEAPHVQYTLSDPDAYEKENIFVIGAGDSAIENALALAEKNSVSLLNRGGEFPYAKDANARLITSAIEAGNITCYYNSDTVSVGTDTITVATPDGDVTAPCNRIIARIGALPPRKFLEEIGVEFPSPERTAVPVVDEKYESNVPGLYIIGALIGYPLIKQAMNQGHEVIEHILGNPIEPADQVIINEKLGHLAGDVNENLQMIRDQLPLFKTLSTPQFRELIADSTVHVVKQGAVICKRNDYTDTLISIVSGSVLVQVGEESPRKYGPGNFLGEVAIFSGRRRDATVVANEKCVLLETQRRQVLKLISSVERVKTVIDQVFMLRALESSVFPDADPVYLRSLLPKIKRENFKKGTVVFEEGDLGDKLYIIRKGSVKISRRNRLGVDVPQTYIPAGNYFGEMALLGREPEPRSATVSAAVASELLYLERSDVQDLLAQNPETREKIEKQAEERRVENLMLQQERGEEGELLDFMFKEGVTDADNVLLIDSDRCIGCDNCEKACAATHFGNSRLDRKGGQSFASIQIPISCRHCENPLCMLDCPPDALTRKPDGEVVIKDTCIGCGNCVMNCPYGVIQLVKDKSGSKFPLLSWFGFGSNKASAGGDDIKKAAKCDMCESLKGGPACVRSCPTGAAMRVHPRVMFQLIEQRRETSV